MPRSMTGFGVAEGPAHGSRLQVEIRTVNHKHLSVQLRLPADLQPLEGEIRDALRQRLERGHVAMTARWQNDTRRVSGFRVDLERAREIVGALRELKTALGLPGEVDLAFVARQPDVLLFGEGEATPVTWPEIQPVVNAAVEAVLAMREREGQALARELDRQLGGITGHARRVAGRAPERLVSERDRLRRAVAELLDGRTLDEHRLMQEIALLADRIDITEELTRLDTHVAACRASLADRAPVGRKLGFLGQEMLREINTIGSKAADAAIAQWVIEMKGELEKFREQVENIE